MASVTVTFVCPACQRASEATVRGLRVPDVPVMRRGRVVLLRPAVAAREIEAGNAKPITVPTKTLEDLAAEALVHATCPACGARNPVGTKAEARSVLLARVQGLLMLVVSVIGAWLFPPFALAMPVLSVFFLALAVIVRQRARAPMPPLQIAFGIAAPVLLGWFALRVPHLAWLVPFPLLVPSMVRPAARGEARWEEASRAITFAPRPVDAD